MSVPIRVLLISHTCQSETEGQPKAERLAEMADIQLKVITPDRWKHYGQWRKADQNQRAVRGNVSAERVRWPWAGPAQFYLHWYPRLKRILLEFRPDVIDLWEEPWALVSAHACRLRNRLLPEARIVSETEQNIDKALPFPFERFRTYTLQNADWVVGHAMPRRSRSFGQEDMAGRPTWCPTPWTPSCFARWIGPSAGRNCRSTGSWWDTPDGSWRKRGART